MEDVNISKYRAQVVRAGSTPASPGFVVSEGQDPVNPSGSSNYVPYSGAISNVDFGEFGLDTGFVTLDTTPTNIPTEQGGIYWDDARSTAALIMNGTLQHIGQDTFFYVKNSTGSSIPKGTAVRFDGTDGASGHLKIAPFLANGTYPSNYFMGVTAEAIANGEFGQVMHFGELTGVNTSGYTAGALLYASTSVAGAFQTTAPVAPNNIVLVAAAINSTNNGTILVRPTYGSNINQDEGVKITSGTTGDLLQLQAGGLWENKTLAQVIGSAYVPSTRTITINGTSQDLSANRTYNVGTVTAVTASSPLFSSGGATPNITIQQASGSQNGFLSSTDWTTFNNKQNALTNPVTGTGTSGQVAYFNGTSAITGESGLVWDATNNYLSIGGATANSNLTVSGSDNTDIFTVLAGANSRLHVGTVTTGTNVHVRSQNNYTLNLGVNNTNYLSIFNSGNIFIGTSASDAGFKLDVNGTGRFSSTGNALRIASTSTASNVQLYITNNNNGDVYTGVAASDGSSVFTGTTAYSGYIGTNLNVPFYIATGGTTRLTLSSTGAATFSSSLRATEITAAMPSGNGALYINNSSLSNKNWTFIPQTSSSETDLLLFYTGSGAGTRMTLTSGGNLGIGTTAPSAAAGLALAMNSGANQCRIALKTSSTGDASGDGFQIGIAGLSAFIEQRENADLTLATNATERMRITSGGNVLIGTTTEPGERITLNGRIGIVGATVASGNTRSFFVRGSQNVADGGTLTINVSNTALIFIAENNTGTGALFFCGYASGTITKISDPSNMFDVADTAGKLCIFKSAVTDVATVKNRLGSTKNITVSYIGVSD